MSFPTGDITLSEICDEYSVQKSISALRGKIYYYANGTSTLVPSSGDVGINQFKGKYHSTTQGTLANQQVNHSNSGFWDGGVSGYINFTNASYTVIGNTLVSLTLRFSEGGGNSGATSWSGNNSTNITVKFDNQIISTSIGLKTFTVSATSTLAISIFNQSSNNLGCQSGGGRTYTYNISSSGLSGPI